MADRIKQIPKRLLEMWNKYSTKQKTLIISVVCVVVLAFALLIFLIQKVDYTVLKRCETANEANEVRNVLKDEGITYRYDEGTMTFYVDDKQKQDAYFALIENDIPTTGVTLEDLLNNSMETTTYDRSLKFTLYYQEHLRKEIKEMVGIDDVEVYYIPTESADSILGEIEDTGASVLLTVNDDFEPETAQTIAEVVATAIGNKNTDKIKVADQNGNLLFGGEKDLYSGSASSNEDYKERLRNTFINNLYMALIKNGYEDAEIAPNLVFDMDKVNEMYTEYLPAEGQDQGLYEKSYTYNSENAGSSGGVPGTTSNDETGYLTPDSSSSTGNVEIEQYNYLPNQRVTNTEYEIGAVIPEKSSIAIVLRKINTIKEEVLEKQGALDDISFEEYISQNSQLKPAVVDPQTLTLVSKATGIAEGNIAITAWEQPVFVPKVEKVREWTDYLQIALAVLIVGLLLFVVFKGVKPVEVTELEPELSVEQLLATTKENQSIEDIEFNEVSEVRRMIEKFVDEKPEAVAQLLRNWLNEDWS